ncbi:MAG: APC family permease [Lachnospiraceae bacterium]
MEKAPKKFRMFDAVLTVICIVFVAEAAAPVATLGNSQYFWWIALIILYLIPYGLIAAELGTAYQGEGGLYNWVRKAYGDKWASREAWYYWVNYPIWKASLAVMFPQIIEIIIGKPIGAAGTLLIELAFIWLIVLISFFRVSDSAWILKGSAAVKIFLALTVGILGIYCALHNGIANEFTVKSFLPRFDLKSLSYLAVILFNFHGFEIISTMADTMEKPSKQIPKAIITGGLVIALIYIFTAFGIGVAIPSNEISTSTGLIDSIQLLTGGKNGGFLIFMSVLFLITLIGNMIAWALGANSVAAYAAEQGDMPKVFASRFKKTGMPKGASIMNGVIASVIVIIALVIPNKNLFWSFFALNLVMILLAYALVFPAFLKLRKTDPDGRRPFKVSGKKWFIRMFAVVPFVLTLMAAGFLVIPFSTSKQALMEVLPVTIGAIIFILIGEMIVLRCKYKKNKIK